MSERLSGTEKSALIDAVYGDADQARDLDAACDDVIAAVEAILAATDTRTEADGAAEDERRMIAAARTGQVARLVEARLGVKYDDALGFAIGLADIGLLATPDASTARIAHLEAALAAATGERDAARSALGAVERYGQSKAIGAHARGHDEEERRWLDLLINVTAALTTTQPAL